MNEKPPKEWFDMAEVRRRSIASSVWIPLRRIEVVGGTHHAHRLGEWEDTDLVSTVAVATEHREIAENLDWNTLGLHSTDPFASTKHPYKPAEVYWYNDGEPIGVDLVLAQRLNSRHEPIWLLNQDVVCALRLLQEGDKWLSVDEGYAEVARQRRDAKGKVISIEMKSEYLRDYLAARRMALRIAQYRCRVAILKDAAYLGFSRDGEDETDTNSRFSRRVFPVDADGGLGGGVAVMHVWRTDVDHGEDVPVFGRETDQNTASCSFSYEKEAKAAFRADGELWRMEWLEPSAQSIRVRGDKPVQPLSYIVDASGETLPATDLDDEDVGRWLWFRADVIPALLAFRGSDLSWYTRQTGSVKCSPDYETHFGINAGGLTNVYAYDVAKLPLWQQRVWHGFNATPDGPVSTELMSAQMGGGPADTTAPESAFVENLGYLDSLVTELYGAPLFRPHNDRAHVLAAIHRFRALPTKGILALAKDIARITADSIDIPLLRKVLQCAPDDKRGSLKLLEALAAAKVGAEAARKMTGPLFGIYELRLGDAHLASSKLDDAFTLAGIDATAQPIDQALQLLDSACLALDELEDALSTS